jgi:hypothetical protein
MAIYLTWPLAMVLRMLRALMMLGFVKTSFWILLEERRRY